MKVEFEFTVDDMVDLNLRTLDRSKGFQSNHWKSVIQYGLLVGLCIYLMLPFSMGVRIASGAAGLAAMLIAQWLNGRREFGKRMRSLYLEQLGKAGPFTCEVELSEAGLITRQEGREVKHSWTTVEEIKETPDSIDFFTHDGNAVIVRDRAFAVPDDKRKFLTLARQYCTGVVAAGVECGLKD